MTLTGSVSEYHRGESGSRLEKVATDVTYTLTQSLQRANVDLAPSTTEVLVKRTHVASREPGDSYDVDTLAASAAINYSIKGGDKFMCLYCGKTLTQREDYDKHILKSESGIRLVCITY